MIKTNLSKPAIEGGEPVREKFLLAFRPKISNLEIKEVSDTLRSGWITTGPKVQKFQEAVRNYLGCKHTQALSSCTAGLHLSLVASNIGNGDEVITTPFTFVSTVNVILHQGARPVFVDIQKDTFNIDPGGIEKAITNRTRAIMPVHYAGQACEMDEILAIARRHNLVVIEDAAHAIGSEYRGRKIGNFGNFTVFSFYAAKNLTTAEGGIICTQSDEMIERLNILSLHGMNRDAWKRYSAGASWYYEVIYPGYKYNMTDIQASLGIHQLNKLEGFIQKKEAIAQMYRIAFQDMPEIVAPTVRSYVRHSWYLYPIMVNTDLLRIDRNRFIEALKAENIGTSVHFIPVHLHPYYQKTFNFKKGDFPASEYVFARIISLPIHSAMTMQDAKDVVRAVSKIVSYYKK